MLHVLLGDGQVTVDNANVIAFAHTQRTELYRTHGGGNLGCLDALRRVGHDLAVGGEIGCVVKADQRGNSLRHGVGGHDIELFVRQVDYLAGAEGDVVVVGEENDFLRGNGLDRFQQFFSAGIHG